MIKNSPSFGNNKGEGGVMNDNRHATVEDIQNFVHTGHLTKQKADDMCQRMTKGRESFFLSKGETDIQKYQALHDTLGRCVAYRPIGE